ncbi:adenylate/guanylate cyclase domain-containing protein, partial [Candidatus Ozemobacteraceae bacterium]|nr:adenylate/guanylate cyclase domain-containing protein [Candidatus Ozemobacteraceae bacterium]
TSERGVTRRMVCRPRRVYSLTASWKPAGKGLAIECAAPLGLYDTHGRIDPLRMLFLRAEMRADKLVSPLRAHEKATRALVMFAWLSGALILLRLGFTGNLGPMPLRTKLVILMSIAVGLPLILFLLTATAYNRYSEILTRQERMNRLRQKLAQIESSVHSFGISMQRRVIEIRNRLSTTLGADEQAIRSVIQELAALRLYDSAYFVDSRGRTISIPLSDHERQVSALMAQRKIHFFFPSIVGVLKARGMLSPSIYEKLSSTITPISGGVALLHGLSSTHTNDFIVQEGRSLDVEMPILGPRHFQLFFPFKATADGTVTEDAALMLIGRPELVPAATFDSLFKATSSYFREMDGEYETRIAIFQIDTAATGRLYDAAAWPNTAHADEAMRGLARRALENRWTGVLSRPDESIEAARIFSRHPYIAVGIAEARGSMQQGLLSLTFWLLAAYTLALLMLAGHFLGRLFANPLDGLIAAVHRLRHGEFGLTVEIRSADEFEVIGNEISSMSRGVRERNRLRRFVSGLAADAVASGREAGVRVEMTILFAHIRDFTAVSDVLGASGTVALLNGYFTAMEAAVVSHAGTIDKFIGDAVMAVFHPDRTGPTHPTAACRAAATMRKALREFNLDRSAGGDREIAIGIGIATGTVISGRVGSAIRRQDFTVIGDTVNLAARLSSLACSDGFGAVLLSGATASSLEPSFRTRAAGEVRVKGKLESVVVHELAGAEET